MTDKKADGRVLLPSDVSFIVAQYCADSKYGITSATVFSVLFPDRNNSTLFLRSSASR